jgi:hypothetical protein
MGRQAESEQSNKRSEKIDVVLYPGTFYQTSCFTNNPELMVDQLLGTAAAQGPQQGLPTIKVTQGSYYSYNLMCAPPLKASSWF